MKLPDDECARVATSGWLTELEKELFDGGPNLMIDTETVRMLIGALKHERKRSAELVTDLVTADRLRGLLSEALTAMTSARDAACEAVENLIDTERRTGISDREYRALTRIAELRKVGR